jgi:hypothetical protein
MAVESRPPGEKTDISSENGMEIEIIMLLLSSMNQELT